MNDRCVALFVLGALGVADAQMADYRPTPEQLAASYLRAGEIGREYEAKAFQLRLEANWIDGGKRFWYRQDRPEGVRRFVMVNAADGSKAPAFDHAKVAKALGEKVDADRLPFRAIEFVDGGKAIRFDVVSDAVPPQRQIWQADLATYKLTKVAAKPPTEQRPDGPWRQNLWEAEARPVHSPDGAFSARIYRNAVLVKPKDGEEFPIGEAGTPTHRFSRLRWTPDSKRIVAFRVVPGDRKQVHLFESTPKDGGPSVVRSRVYDRPGDRVDVFDMLLLDVESKSVKPVEADPVDFGDLPDIQWKQDKRRFTYERMDRGYGRWRVIEVDSVSGASRTIVDDDPATFFDSTAMVYERIEGTDEILWRSERDGWGHLYLSDGEGGPPVQITKGAWVVRKVEKVDAKARQIVFAASGMHPGEDPYQIHLYRVNFDGTGLTPLTPAPGHHTVQFSPDGETLVDTYSTLTEAPVHEFRNAKDGRLLATLEKADVEALRASGWPSPEPFVAKGRDGKTDIYGVVYRPSHFDPALRYPVIEDIYAGPQDSFVPKSFAAYRWNQSLAELGFIVVQIDGMGTRNRGKAFHDVCYKNLGDAGLPDRKLWITALGAKLPQADIGRVGVFGTSAGGQSSTGALLFHPDFYKVGVSSCGCHDNRLDKIWWNEQWMGYPVGPEYAASSNIDHAANLRGRLMLMVGELDDNVPPESTYRLADALIKAGRDFELVLLPGQGHTGGGTFGERKRRDFFVRHLLGVEPPAWNAQAPE